MEITEIMFYIYIIIYTIYTIFHYSICTDLLNGNNIKYINFNSNSKNFICRRILQLSLITLLISAIACKCKNINCCIVAILLNIIVVIFYIIKWYPFKDKSTYFFHVLWAIPIIILPLFLKLNGKFNINYIIITIILLLLYKIFIENYVYLN